MDVEHMDTLQYALLHFEIWSFTYRRLDLRMFITLSPYFIIHTSNQLKVPHTALIVVYC
jgi:hypothetical protein